MANMPPTLTTTKGVFQPTSFEKTSWENVPSDFQSISAMPQYQHFSHEELRLFDYQNDLTFSTLRSGLLPAMFRNATLPRAPPLQLLKPFKRYGADIITFEVGKEGLEGFAKFAVHESLISYRSEFVRLAMQKEWKEGKDRRIPLSEDDPLVFEIYQLFLYDQEVYSTNDVNQFQLLVKAYILGEKLFDIGFKNAVIDVIIIKLRNTGFFDPQLSGLVYDNTPENSPLRRLLRDIYVWTGSAKWIDEKQLEEPINGDFLRDVTEGQFLARQENLFAVPPFLNDLAGWTTYHEQVDKFGDKVKKI